MLNAHKDQYLTGLSAGIFPEGFAGEFIAPTIPVKKDTNKIVAYEKDHLRLPASAVGDSNPATILDFTSNELTYTCVRNALKSLCYKREIKRADNPIKPIEAKTRMLTSMIQLWREYQIAYLAVTSGNYASGMTSSPTQWNAANGTGNPISDVSTAIAAIKANLAGLPHGAGKNFVGVVDSDGWKQLKDHPEIIDRTKRHQMGTTEDSVAEVLDLKKLVVASVQYNSTAVGQTPSMTSLWGKNMVVAYVDPNPSEYTATAFLTFSYENQVRKAQEADPEGTWVIVERSIDVLPLLVDTVSSGKISGAYLLSSVVA